MTCVCKLDRPDLFMTIFVKGNIFWHYKGLSKSVDTSTTNMQYKR